MQKGRHSGALWLAIRVMGVAGSRGENAVTCTGVFVCIHELTLSSPVLAVWVHPVASTE